MRVYVRSWEMVYKTRNYVQDMTERHIDSGGHMHIYPLLWIKREEV